MSSEIEVNIRRAWSSPDRRMSTGTRVMLFGFVDGVTPIFASGKSIWQALSRALTDSTTGVC